MARMPDNVWAQVCVNGGQIDLGFEISVSPPSPGHSLISTVIQELKSADTHEWVKVDGTSAIVGTTVMPSSPEQKQPVQDHLGEVVYVELPEVGAPITQGSSCGAVESVKATSEVISPVSGKVIKVKEKLSHSPGLVNSSPYDEGWMLKVEVSEAEEVKSLMGSEKYSKFCEEENANH